MISEGFLNKSLLFKVTTIVKNVAKTMKYIDEVCAVLTDEVERRYLRSRDAWQTLTDEVSAADGATPK